MNARQIVKELVQKVLEGINEEGSIPEDIFQRLTKLGMTPNYGGDDTWYSDGIGRIDFRPGSGWRHQMNPIATTDDEMRKYISQLENPSTSWDRWAARS